MTTLSYQIMAVLADDMPHSVRSVKLIVGGMCAPIRNVLRKGAAAGRFECVGGSPVQYRITSAGMSLFLKRQAEFGAVVINVPARIVIAKQPALVQAWGRMAVGAGA